MVANTVILLAILELFSFTEAAIAVSGGNQINGTVGDDVTIPWVYDFESDVFSVDWRFTDSTSNTVTVMTQTGMATPVVVGGFNIRHNNNGNVTLTNAFVNNTGTYTCSVSYTLASGQSAVTGTADVIISEPTGGGGDGPPLEIIIPVVVVVVVIIIIIVVAHVIVWLKHGKREKGAAAPAPAPAVV